MKIQHWIAGLAFMGVGCVEASHLEERTSAAAIKQGALPEIYLIGDSIRIGYCKRASMGYDPIDRKLLITSRRFGDG